MSIQGEHCIGPTIHLNGTSKRELLRLYDEAFTVLFMLRPKINALAPHMRDYPVPMTFEQARNQHDELRSLLDRIEGGLGDVYQLISGQ